MSKKIEVQKIPGAVVSYFLDRISKRSLGPGEKLAPQRQLAQELGIGLSSLREALHSLETLGIVSVRRGKGTFITSEAPEAVSKRLAWLLTTTNAKVGELLEIRRILETELAGLAAERATEEDIRNLDGLLSNIRKAILQDDRRLFDELDFQFHVAVGQATQNSTAVRLLSVLYGLVAEVSYRIPPTEELLDWHREVAAAIGRRDPQAARNAVQALLLAVSDAVQPEREEPSEG